MLKGAEIISLYNPEEQAAALYMHLLSDPHLQALPISQELIYHTLYGSFHKLLAIEPSHPLYNIVFALRLSDGESIDLSGIKDRVWIRERSLEIAHFRKEDAIVQLIIRSIRELPSAEQQNIFILAAAFGHVKVVFSLLNWIDFDENTYRSAVSACQQAYPGIAKLIHNRYGDRASADYKLCTISHEDPVSLLSKLITSPRVPDDNNQGIHTSPMPYYLQSNNAVKLKTNNNNNVKKTSTTIESNSLFQVHSAKL